MFGLRSVPGGSRRRPDDLGSRDARRGPAGRAPAGARGSRVKRGVDLLGAATGLVVLSPVLVLTSIAILLADGPPLLFRQRRPGLAGRPFTILKFRTMRAPRAGEVWYQTDALRVTRLGRFLRASSLDELPELWNVLRGEMSLVGPRPLLMEYLGKYTPEEERRHDVPPGITGWAAINGRHALKFKERLALDVWYVDHWSLWLDLVILARTVLHVLRRSNVSETQDLDDIGFPLPRVPPGVPGTPAPLASRGPAGRGGG